MKLLLQKLPSTLRGIYGPKHDHLGEHQLFAHPDLAVAIERLEKDNVYLVYSDIYRTPQASRDARRAKPGLVLPAGFSPHNVGLAIDIDYAVAMKELRLDKKGLDWLLEGYGLYCHRKDHALSSEAWHYNALTPHPEQWIHGDQQSTNPAVEAKIQALYGKDLILKEADVRAYLVQLGYLPIGRELSEGVKLFQKEWDLDVDGKAGEKTQRTLAFVCAERVSP